MAVSAAFTCQRHAPRQDNISQTNGFRILHGLQTHVCRVRGHHGPIGRDSFAVEGTLECCAVSDDGKRIVAAGEDGLLMLDFVPGR